jgi:diguanylate cyclase (GGDEF)-like protein
VYSIIKSKNKIKQMTVSLNQSQAREESVKQELAAFQKKLHTAIQDPITHLLGWQLFEDRLHQGIEESARYQTTLGVLFIDINDFKIINTALGTEIADAVLLDLANKLSSCIRKVDSLSRYHKDIFVVLLNQLNKPETAVIVAQRILQAMAQPLQVESHELYLTASIGIAIYPGDGESVMELLRSADQALSVAKQRGKQTYQFYQQEMHTNSQRELMLTKGLWREWVNEEFSIYFQPIMDMQNETMIGMDTLMHWRHPELGLIMQQELYDCAEKHKRLNELSVWLLRQVCNQFIKWRALGFCPAFLAIPLSLKQLENTSFIYQLSQVLQECAFDPEHLILEIKENSQYVSLDVLEKSFNMLRYLNIKLAIDHFGANAFSLGYFKYGQVHFLKLDSSFIEDITHQAKAVALVESMVFLAKKMNMQLIIQGVQTEAQIALLKTLGCTLMQGQGVFAPLSSHDVLQKMATT